VTQTTWPRTILAGLFVGAALVAEHALLYDEQAMEDEPELTLFASNVLGTTTIAAGVMLAAESAEEAARHLVIAALGGAVVLGLRIARRELRLRRTTSAEANQAIGLSRGVRSYGQSYGGRDPSVGRN
jgi:hypothetical protein